MRAFEEKKNIYYKHKRENPDLVPVEPPALFKVVVNNYRPEKEDVLEKSGDENDPTMISGQYGLPKQPASYLKYPEYDWF